MHRFLSQILRKLPLPWRSRTDRRLKLTRARHAQFASFMESCGCRTHDVDRYEQGLRRRRFAKAAMYWLSAAGSAWVLLESARALTLY